jgi:Ca2+/Na+ antiporter
MPPRHPSFPANRSGGCLDLTSLRSRTCRAFFGAEYLVKRATSVARSFRHSPTPIGLTFVGFGTSLPEMATSIIAAIRRLAA